MNSYKIIGSFHISPHLKQLSSNKYALNLEKIFSHIQSYVKFNGLIDIPSKHNILSYIVPDYKIKLYNKSSLYLLPKLKNVKITIYYTEKNDNNITILSSNDSNINLIKIKKKKKFKFLTLEQYITLTSTQKISKVVLSGLILDAYNSNYYQVCSQEKKLLKDVFCWFSNSHIYSINKLVEILQSTTKLTEGEKINLIRSEMVSITNDFINSGIINEVCNKLEKIISINKI
jgi:hypothetical protein